MTVSGRSVFRLVLWAGLLETARAKWTYTGLWTSWVFHATIDSFLIWFPEIYTAFSRLARLDDWSRRDSSGTVAALHGTLTDVVAENPRWIDYVAPVVLAYILAYPRYDMYKSEWANEQIFGMGLDSIPHAATAYSLTQLVFDCLKALDRHTPDSGPVGELIAWAGEHAEWVAFVALALSTIGYETGEYFINRSELQAVGGDPRKVALDWSREDTIYDILSNIVGAVGALVYHRYSTPRQASVKAAAVVDRL
jgi:hypothetical protein